MLGAQPLIYNHMAVSVRPSVTHYAYLSVINARMDTKVVSLKVPIPSCLVRLGYIRYWAALLCQGFNPTGLHIIYKI